MRHLVIGMGETGRSFYNVMNKYHQIFIVDEKWVTAINKIEIIHICFPYSEKFISEVKRYQKKYKPKYTIIHATVPVGTSRQCEAIHSPIIGIHPLMEESLLTFTKFLSGNKANDVADLFRRAKMKVYLFDNQETTELLKLVDTTFYGLCIEYTKEIKKMCQKYNVPFEAWTIYNSLYNQGYQKLGFSEYIRPNLIPIMKKIGGHCILPNCELLESKFAKFIKELNETPDETIQSQYATDTPDKTTESV